MADFFRSLLKSLPKKLLESNQGWGCGAIDIALIKNQTLRI